MKRLTHDAYYVQLLHLVAARSTCVRRAVAAIIVDVQHRVLATGYNGVPSGFAHCIDTPCPGARDVSGDTRRCLAVHAEQNAILQCHELARAHTLYLSVHPCKICALMIANTPICRVVTLGAYADEGRVILACAGVELITFEPTAS